MNERRRALGAITACVLFWGLSFISIKTALPVFPPMTLGALRFALAVLFLLVIKGGAFTKGRAGTGEKLRLRDLPLLTGAGISGVTLYFFCENNGVALVSASEASIIVAAIPVLTMIAEGIGKRLFPRREAAEAGPDRRGSLFRWTGALISVAGVWFVAGGAFSPASPGAGGTPAAPAGLSGGARGCLFMAGAALSWVAYSFLTRPLFRRCSRLHITFWQSVFGFAGFLPFALREYPRWGRPGLPVILHLAFLGICCSALGYWFYVRALEVLGVSRSAVFVNFIPVVTVIAGFFLLGERLSPLQWAGAAMVLLGVYLATREWKRPRRL
jgi:drug/metabolite transporter (DMT)-like permease